jgi:pectate lyase
MGFRDDDAFDWYVTLHQNWYDTVGSRLPLQRGGLTHIFNYYYRDVTVSGINSRVTRWP